jgi:hypothetical protein
MWKKYRFLDKSFSQILQDDLVFRRKHFDDLISTIKNYLALSPTVGQNKLQCLSREVLPSTADLLVLTSLDQLVYILKILFSFF